jgi:hypothetical protein
MAEVTTTTSAVFIAELWSEAILDYAEREFRLVNQVTDLSASVPNGDKLHIPKVSEETAATLSSGSAVSYGANTDSEIELSINQHIYEAKRIGDLVKVQSNPDLFSMYARSMGYAIAKKIENYIAVDVLQSATGNDVSLASDNTLTTALLRSGLQKLLDANHSYTDGDTYFYASPSLFSSLLSLQDFTDASRRGDGANPNVTGSLGSIYGVEVFPSNDWDDDGGTNDESGTIFKSSGVYYASQLQPRVQESYDIDYLASSIVVDSLFGAVLSHGASSTSLPVVNFNNP